MEQSPTLKWEKLDAEFWSKNWIDEPEIIVGNGAKIERFSTKTTFIAKLTFNQPQRCSGTGFFVNIHSPNLGQNARDDSGERGPAMFPRIVLTAAHNLIGNNKQLSTDFEIEHTLNIVEDGKEQLTSVKVKLTHDQFFICEKYREDPGPHNSRYDWGFLILGEGYYPLGFGISLLFSLDDQGTRENSLLSGVLKKNGVQILGYSDDGDNQITSGPGAISSTGEIEYEAETKPGISGSPVWVPYQGLATVIAIHAHGSGKSKKSRGTRIGFELLQELYRQAGLGYFSRTLKAVRVPIPKPNVIDPFPKGVYLHFSSVRSRARVHYGATGLQTTFDIIPALTQPSPGTTVLYAFRFHGPAGESGDDNKLLWVLWNLEMNRVTLSDHLHPACLVELIPGKKSTQSVQIGFPQSHSQTAERSLEHKKQFILLLGAQRLRIDDWEELGIPAVSSEVGMLETKLMQRAPDEPQEPKGRLFNHFRFEYVN